MCDSSEHLGGQCLVLLLCPTVLIANDNATLVKQMCSILALLFSLTCIPLSYCRIKWRSVVKNNKRI